MEQDFPFSSSANSAYKSPEGEGPGKNLAASPPTLALPKGGGSIKAIDEKISVNFASGTCAFSLPFPFSPSRNAFMPELALSYNSGSGNSIFGLGWSAEPGAITRKTDRQLPQYDDATASDTFIFSGSEDLVPVYKNDGAGNWTKDEQFTNGQIIQAYRPRIEGSFARIERITETTNVYWKVTSRDNVVSIYGKSKTAQLADPEEPARIFKWLFEFSYDSKGNCFQYEYKPEDCINVQALLHEKNRLYTPQTFTNVYLKRIKYANNYQYTYTGIDLSDGDHFTGSIDYLLELVLDYGEHDPVNPQPLDNNGWLCRPDPFSSYRSGFEIRTYRTCSRILMFHHFTELGALPCLVGSMDIRYSSGSGFTFLNAITQKGYIRKADGTYSEKSMPPVEFTYQELGWNTRIHTLPAESLENLPAGIDTTAYKWMDLYGEGLSGIFTEQAGGWYYKSNSGDGNFDPTLLVYPRPSLNGLSTEALHFRDLEANGKLQLVSNELQGYYQLGADDTWLPFRHFQQTANVDLSDPNLNFIDLTGDGQPDLLISEDDVFIWYESEGKNGYGKAQILRKTFNEEKGPAIIFQDGTGSIVLADMTGDGLVDIVRIRNSDIVYWPNLGYGRFGSKVSMSNTPLLDQPDHFDVRYLKLADIDGSGTTDMVYLAKDSFKVYFNQSGNSWTEENSIYGVNPLLFPKIDNLATVSLVDLLGNGTGCLVWSSPLPGSAQGRQLQYIDLMGGEKPYILSTYKNNMGREISINYKPSTYFYLADKKAGNPWITRLPFPVQCVSDVQAVDQVAKSRFTNHYTYHHGYYDYDEREFRGFGRVEQTDTETYEQYKKMSDGGGNVQLVDERFFEPPVLTKTWFHTGAFLEGKKILNQFAHEYYQNTFVAEKELIEPLFPAGLTSDEIREALRACKGMPLHAEIYSPDGTDKQFLPYSTAHHSSLIQLVQPRLENQYGVFTVQECESLVYAYERTPADPRIAHHMNIDIDAFGNVVKAASVTYGRKILDAALTPSEQAEQRKTYILFSENSFSNLIDDGIGYHLPLGYQNLGYELTGVTPAGTYFDSEELANAYNTATQIPYQALPTPGLSEKRLIGQECRLFLKNDLSGPLDPGTIESLALTYQSYKLSLSPGLRDSIFGDKVSDALLLNEGRYVHFNDANYWIVSGTQTYDAGNFYQVIKVTDAFSCTSEFTYDPVYHFFIRHTSDMLQNTTEILQFNFRTLSPWLMLDSNDNRTGVRMDELGMVMQAFVMGKEAENKGDYIDTGSSEASVNDLPSTSLEYELFNYLNTQKPNFIKGSVRETDYFDSQQSGQVVKWQTSYTYVSGDGKAAMQKIQAEPGIALQENEDGTVTETDTTPQIRWIGNGRVIFNNKGNPVKQYEPYFSVNADYEDAKLLVERGVTPILHYDSMGRLIRTDFPDGTFTRIEFDAWMYSASDKNDTVLESQWYRDRILFPVIGMATPDEIAAANRAAVHAHTPSLTYLDSLGRDFLAVADNGALGKYRTTSVLTMEGHVLRIIDGRGNPVMQYTYDMLGNALYHMSMDTGERWVLPDVMGKPVYSWDSRGYTFRNQYDILHRPVKCFVKTGNENELNFEKITYGEGISGDKTLNLRGKVYQRFDNAGIATSGLYDFKGNLLESSMQLCQDYKNTTDWNTSPLLEGETFTSSTRFDALNRPVSSISADQSIYIPLYNEANLLNSVDVHIKGAALATNFVANIEYDVKGRRESILYGNHTKTTYSYDPLALRLRQLLTTGNNGADLLQKLHYTYDPSGNISHIEDAAQQTMFFKNSVISPSADYVYDALYQLINATGREHIGQNGPASQFDEFRINLPMPGDGAAMRTYTEQYTYDQAGNLLQMRHMAPSGNWTRTYAYEQASNRLLSTTVNGISETYAYDAHGSMRSLANAPGLTWNFKNELQQVNLGGGGTAYYVYAGGQRIRKVIERQGGIREERIYLGGFELYRQTTNAGHMQEETETLHIADDTGRIAIVETKTVKDGISVTEQLIRYQYSNHQGSSALELDDAADIISYEEYYPFGCTAYQAINKTITANAKRYRYTGMERDDETGLEYHGSRYYIPWLGRWLSADPAGIEAGINLYMYAHNSPIVYTDTNGMDPGDPQLNVSPNINKSQGATEYDEENNTLRVSEDHYATPILSRLKTHGDQPTAFENQLLNDFTTDRIYGYNIISDASGKIFGYVVDNAHITADNKYYVSGLSYTNYYEGIFNRQGDFVGGRMFSPNNGTAISEAGPIPYILGAGIVKKLLQTSVAKVAGAFLTGVSTGEAFTGRSITGDKLSGTERVLAGGLAVFGWADMAMQAGVKLNSLRNIKLPRFLNWLGKIAGKQPYKFGNAGAGALGSTAKEGSITIRTGLSGSQLGETVRHEGLHRLLTPLGTDSLTVARQDAGMWAYTNIASLRYLEEGLAQSVGTGSFGTGFKWITSMRGPAGYNISIPIAIGQGLAYIAGLGALFYGGARLSPFK